MDEYGNVDCENVVNCRNCTYCYNSMYCYNSTYCYNSSDCYNSTYCYNSSDCANSTYCYNSSDCANSTRCNTCVCCLLCDRLVLEKFMVFNQKVSEEAWEKIREKVFNKFELKHPANYDDKDIAWLKKNIKQFDAEVMQGIINNSVLPDKPAECEVK